MGCISHLLYEVDHAGLSVSHLPVKGQGLQAVVAGKRAPRAEVHGAAGLGVAGHRFPPVGPLFVLWRQREWKSGLKGGGVGGWTGRKQRTVCLREHLCPPVFLPAAGEWSESRCHS